MRLSWKRNYKRDVLEASNMEGSKMKWNKTDNPNVLHNRFLVSAKLALRKKATFELGPCAFAARVAETTEG